jgi:hypothetical protein
VHGGGPYRKEVEETTCPAPDPPEGLWRLKLGELEFEDDANPNPNTFEITNAIKVNRTKINQIIDELKRREKE